MALLSLNLAVFNMLPVPALDGGKILLYLLEKLHHRLARLHIPLSIGGWVCILGLMIYATYLDVERYIVKLFT
jgi:regulator of sigma E protease